MDKEIAGRLTESNAINTCLPSSEELTKLTTEGLEWSEQRC